MLPLKSDGSTVFEAGMRVTLVRIAKHGLPTAALLALLGFLMAEMAGIWVASQPAPSAPRASVESPADTAAPADRPDTVAVRALRYQLPLEMAAWGFGLVVLCELWLALWRSKKPPMHPPGLRPPTDAEVEELLNQLLQQAEEAEAARKAAAARPADTPPPCPNPAPADNTPVSN
jgi:hypothetical protein